jgi:surfeit locus 1 family protein
MQPEARSPRSTAKLALLLAFALLAGAGFFALGVWQVQRLAWKEALIARVDRYLHSPPVSAPRAAQWPALEKDEDEYRRVQVTGRFDYARQVLVRASTVLGPGFWVMTPLQRADDRSWVLVNRGFVPPEQRAQVPQGAAQQTVTGLLRFTEKGFLQHNDPAQGRWYWRDVAQIAAAGHFDAPVAPYFIDVEATPQTAQAWPRAGLTVIHFRNDHLVYAITWFAMFAMVVAAMAYLLIDERRLRRLPEGTSLADRRS